MANDIVDDETVWSLWHSGKSVSEVAAIKRITTRQVFEILNAKVDAEYRALKLRGVVK